VIHPQILPSMPDYIVCYQFALYFPYNWVPKSYNLPPLVMHLAKLDTIAVLPTWFMFMQRRYCVPSFAVDIKRNYSEPHKAAEQPIACHHPTFGSCHNPLLYGVDWCSARSGGTFELFDWQIVPQYCAILPQSIGNVIESASLWCILDAAPNVDVFWMGASLCQIIPHDIDRATCTYILSLSNSILRCNESCNINQNARKVVVWFDYVLKFVMEGRKMYRQKAPSRPGAVLLPSCSADWAQASQ
jgi:hypothetical protein